MDGSILTDVKKVLGIEEQYEHFDPDIILFINMVFNTLYQLGVGSDPSQPFQISDKTSKWSDFDGSDARRNYVKSYMSLRVRKLFDPPNNSFLLDAINKETEQLEHRMLFMEEIPALGGTAPSYAEDNYKYNEETGRWEDGDEG